MKFFTASILLALLAVASANNVKERIKELREMQTPDREVRIACESCRYNVFLVSHLLLPRCRA
jgi:hypothetical protein